VTEGPRVIDALAEAGVDPLFFYDIDTPVTVAALRGGGAEYLRTDQVPLFTRYLSVTGGPFLREVVEGELGHHRRMASVFSDFERRPIAAASIGQVHRAVLREGRREVAVKVRRRDLVETLPSDLATLRLGLRVLARAGVLKGEDGERVMEHWGAQILRELDFRIEMRNARMFRERGAHLLSWARVPEPCWATPGMLVMERLEPGPALAELVPDSPEAHLIARRLLHILAYSLTRGGVVHTDMHPGNVRLLADDPSRLVIYDFGNCVEVTEEMRGQFRGLMAMAARKDVEGLWRLLLSSRLVNLKAGREPREVKALLGRALESALQGPRGRRLAVGTFLELAGPESPFLLEPELLGIGRSVLHVDGLCQQLVPHVDYGEVVRWFVTQQAM
jgi:aarF domain-containing kinase